jgi:hypothetical protein
MDILAGGTGHKINSARKSFSSRRGSEVSVEEPITVEIEPVK